MHCITIVVLFFQGQKTLECGMLWVVATKRWASQTKPKDVMLEPRTVKTDRVLRFIKWAVYIMLWVQNMSKKP